MFYEKKLTSLASLTTAAGTMDSDAGLRVVGRYGKRACYCFVTRFGGTFTVMIYRRSSRRRGPGRLMASLESTDIAQLRRLLREIAGERVRAYLY